ncbi:zinc-dependent alcohol dehydrogenase [Kutzneria sp. CA-103260]|uniref:zinc-dependent alcohol dehydrogenase n=1 Tax=Kutzneria sp. CA-103260 TaxID=2802641 RepID=UPI001BA7660B|nr:alcohol dehydrogenase catalytic domain-containing protein [Kutzneria sp. CA-103260]QUQ64332.1 dehydrogenase [Kutzneria sp. CA-103260]
MESLVVTGPSALEWRDVPSPRLHDDQDALVRPIVSATCDLDRRIVAGGSPFEPPFALGHEAVGEVLEVGDDAGSLAPGDLVVIPWHISCGGCVNCLRGLPGTCSSVPRLASYGTTAGGKWGGLFDEVVRVPWAAHNLVALPATVDPRVAASSADNLTDAFRAVAPVLRADPAASVLVVGGTASLGLLTVLCARTLRAAAVTYADTDAGRLAKAAELGATALALAEYPDRVDGDFDLVVDASANKAGFRCALLSTRPGGTCVIRSIYFGDVPLPYFSLYATGITLVTGPPHATPLVPDVLALIADGSLDPSPILAGPYDCADAVDVLLAPPPGKPQFIRPRIMSDRHADRGAVR